MQYLKAFICFEEIWLLFLLHKDYFSAKQIAAIKHFKNHLSQSLTSLLQEILLHLTMFTNMYCSIFIICRLIYYNFATLSQPNIWIWFTWNVKFTILSDFASILTLLWIVRVLMEGWITYCPCLYWWKQKMMMLICCSNYHKILPASLKR